MKLTQDFAGVASIANHAVGVLTVDKNAYVFSSAAVVTMTDEPIPRNSYKNYLRLEDHDKAEHMWSAIVQNTTPYNPANPGTGYRFSVTCAAQNDAECTTKTTSSFAITDAQPQNGNTAREMKICAKYFTDSATSRNTTTKIYKPNPSRQDNSWCTPAPYKLGDFMVGGVTLLHEMTHLDIVGVRAGYPVFHDAVGNFNYHGIQDIDDLLPLNNPSAQARNPMTFWCTKKNVSGTLEPYLSAGNIAASAFVKCWV